MNWSPFERDVFETLIADCVDELVREVGWTQKAAIVQVAEGCRLSEARVRQIYDERRCEYPRSGSPAAILHEEDDGRHVLEVAGKLVFDDPRLPFERLLGHGIGLALCVAMAAFPTDEACLAEFQPADIRCPRCEGTEIKRRMSHHWWCRPCRRQFSTLAGTPFEGTHLPLRLWMAVLILLRLSGGTIARGDVAHLLGIDAASAGRMLNALRCARKSSPN